MSYPSLDSLRAAHPSFEAIADTLVALADDASVSPEVMERVCVMVMSVLNSWAETTARLALLREAAVKVKVDSATSSRAYSVLRAALDAVDAEPPS